MRVAGVREGEGVRKKQQDRQSLFKGCRQDECSMCIKSEASGESSGGEGGGETERGNNSLGLNGYRELPAV